MQFGQTQEPAKLFELEHRVSGIAGCYKFGNSDPGDRLSMARRIESFTGRISLGDVLSTRARQFGEVIGEPDITVDRIRDNEDLRREFDAFVERRDQKDLQEMLRQLEILNPTEIERIQFDRDNRQQVVDVIHGVVSGFTPADINEYLAQRDTRKQYEPLSTSELERRAMESRILEKLGKSKEITVGWVASMPTLEMIWQQVKDRPSIPLESRRSHHRTKS